MERVMADRPPGTVRRRIEFDAETWHALHRLWLDSMRSVQELADEAFRDLLKKHHRPVTLKDALQRSLRMHPADEQPKATVHRLRRRV
jgi:hypothetical protein